MGSAARHNEACTSMLRQTIQSIRYYLFTNSRSTLPEILGVIAKCVQILPLTKINIQILVHAQLKLEGDSSTDPMPLRALNTIINTTK